MEASERLTRLSLNETVTFDSVQHAKAVADGGLSFRRFRALPGSRLLLSEGRAVPIGSRAFDLLLVLLRARGLVVGKREILRQVWPSTSVEEGNVRLQIASLRKWLGPDRDLIVTVPGRGYMFVAEEEDAVAAMPDSLTECAGCKACGDQERLTSQQRGIRAASRRIWPAGALRVAVIDDDPDIREALIGLLRSAGWCAEAFPSLAAFLGCNPRPSAGCLVLDVWLPGQNGLEFQADLVRANVHLPIVFISGHADVPMSVRAMKAGAVEFLTKPVRHQELLDAVAHAMSGTGAPPPVVARPSAFIVTER